MILFQESYGDHVMHLVEIVLSAGLSTVALGVTIIIYLDKRRRETKREENLRHVENQKAIEDVAGEVKKLQTAEEYMPQHFHQEHYTGSASDSLTVEGIIKKPGNGWRKDGR